MRRACFFFVALLAGCSSDPRRPEFLGGGAVPTGTAPSCRSGEMRPCNYIDDMTLNDAGIGGNSTCIDGAWDSCRPAEDGGSNESG